MADAKIYKVGIDLPGKDPITRTFNVAIYNMYANDMRVLDDKLIDGKWIPDSSYGIVRIMHMYDVNYKPNSPWSVTDALKKKGYQNISMAESLFEYEPTGRIIGPNKLILNTAPDDIRRLSKLVWTYMGAAAADWTPTEKFKQAEEEYNNNRAVRKLEWFM